MVSKGESSIITDFLGIQPNLASGNQRWLDGNSTIYRKCTINPQHIHDWVVVWNMNFIFPYIFRGVETTNQMNLKIHFGGLHVGFQEWQSTKQNQSLMLVPKHP
jgi:hypothetical protein